MRILIFFIVSLVGGFVSCAENLKGEDNLVIIHIAGEVKKAGKLLCKKQITLIELEKIAGGWSDFASPKRIKVIRFHRLEGLKKTGKRIENQFLTLEEVANKKGVITFEEGDIIYVPMKSFMGK